MLDRGCQFAVTFYVVAGFNLLEWQGCQHVGALADLSAMIGADSRDGASGAVRVVARRSL